MNLNDINIGKYHRKIFDAQWKSSKVDKNKQNDLKIYSHYVNLSFMYQERKIRMENFKIYFDHPINFIDSNDFIKKKKDYQINENHYMRLKRHEMSPNDFLFKEPPIGCGYSGEVSKVKKKDTSELFAMKILRKNFAIGSENISFIRAERDLLVVCDSPFVLKLFFIFQDRRYLYMIFELMECDLYKLISQVKRSILEEEIKFYLAEIALGIDALHQLGFVHRDIKSDNILISSDGHCKLADMGECIGPKERHHLGFYEYPETEKEKKFFLTKLTNFDELCSKSSKEQGSLSGKKLDEMKYFYLKYNVGKEKTAWHSSFDRSDHRKDWYSLGKIMCHLLFDIFPFNEAIETKFIFKENEWPLKLPSFRKISEEAFSLLNRLLCPPENRIFNLEELKNQLFFSKFDWNNILNRQAPFKFKPQEINSNVNFKEFSQIEGKLFKHHDWRRGYEYMDTLMYAFDWVFLNFDFIKFEKFSKIFDRYGRKIFIKFSRPIHH